MSDKSKVQSNKHTQKKKRFHLDKYSEKAMKAWWSALSKTSWLRASSHHPPPCHLSPPSQLWAFSYATLRGMEFQSRAHLLKIRNAKNGGPPLQAVADLGFLFEGGPTQTDSWILLANPRFSCELRRWTQNFHAGFGGGPKIFMQFLKADPRTTKVIAPHNQICE